MNIVNISFNVTNSNNYTFRIGFYKDKEKKYSFGLDPAVTYTTSTSSIQQNIKTNYWSFDADPNAHIYFDTKEITRFKRTAILILNKKHLYLTITIMLYSGTHGSVKHLLKKMLCF